MWIKHLCTPYWKNELNLSIASLIFITFSYFHFLLKAHFNWCLPSNVSWFHRFNKNTYSMFCTTLNHEMNLKFVSTNMDVTKPYTLLHTLLQIILHAIVSYLRLCMFVVGWYITAHAKLFHNVFLNKSLIHSTLYKPTCTWNSLIEALVVNAKRCVPW